MIYLIIQQSYFMLSVSVYMSYQLCIVNSVYLNKVYKYKILVYFQKFLEFLDFINDSN